MNAVALLLTMGALAAGAQNDPNAGWVSLFDGKSLDGWKASENKGTFTVKDGMIVANGPRSHLFYVGPVHDANFTNFELKAQIMTKPKSNSGIYFHTAYQETDWPAKGFEVQINNTHSDWKKTGSLYNVVDVNIADPAKARARKDIVDVKVPLAQDDKWFTEYIKVQGKHILIKVDDKVAVDWTQPDDWKGPQGNPGRKLSSGTFALQGHDPGSTVYFKSIQVRPLP
jgi:hypothetical protein